MASCLLCKAVGPGSVKACCIARCALLLVSGSKGRLGFCCRRRKKAKDQRGRIGSRKPRSVSSGDLFYSLPRRVLCSTTVHLHDVVNVLALNVFYHTVMVVKR